MAALPSPGLAAHICDMAKTPTRTPKPDLARTCAIDADSSSFPAQTAKKPALPAVRNQRRANEMIGAHTSQHALAGLLREGRPECAERRWVPHRPPRPEKSEGGFRLVIK